MFSSIKLWIVGIATTAFSVLLLLLKIKTNKLKTANKVIEELGEEIEFRDVEEEVTDKVAREHREETKVIEEEYDDMRVEVTKRASDKPLSDELIELLKQSGRKE